MASGRAVAAIDWSKLTVSLGLKKETVAALIAFRKRNEEARRVVTSLKEQKADIDFDGYRRILKNQAVVNEAEKLFRSYKPSKIDLNRKLADIQKVEDMAVTQAERTASKVNAELQALHTALTNIEQARPFEELTVNEVVAAKPEIDKIVEKRLKKGQWSVPGYEEQFARGSS